jgi:hypothetical protein
MLSNLNTLIGFTAIFALLSLVVTTVTQVFRTFAGMKPKALVETLMRLFGEIPGAERFVATILSHPTLAGEVGWKDYEVLVDPTRENSDPQVVSKTKAILEAYRHQSLRKALGRRLKIVDLDKQTIKDIGSIVYERLAERIDPEMPAGADRLDERLQRWVAPLKEAIEEAVPEAAKPPGAPPTPPMPKPHFGRLWRLATAAFPEAKGIANPVKTYVAAFHDEAAASAADTFTLKVRLITVAAALVVAVSFRLDAIDVWNRMAKVDPAKIDELGSAVSKLSQTAPTSSAAAGVVQKDEPPAETPKKASKKPDAQSPQDAATLTPTAEATQKEPPAETAKKVAKKPDGQPPSAAATGRSTDEARQNEALRAQIAEVRRLATQVQQSPVPLELNLGRWPDYVDLACNPGFWLAVIALSFGAPFWFEALKSAIKMKSAFTQEERKK